MWTFNKWVQTTKLCHKRDSFCWEASHFRRDSFLKHFLIFFLCHTFPLKMPTGTGKLFTSFKEFVLFFLIVCLFSPPHTELLSLLTSDEMSRFQSAIISESFVFTAEKFLLKNVLIHVCLCFACTPSRAQYWPHGKYCVMTTLIF